MINAGEESVSDQLLSIGLVDLIIMAMSVFRLSWMFAYENGPFGVFHFIRTKAGAERTAQGFYIPRNNLSELMTCPLCLSVWFGGFSILFYFLYPWTICAHYAFALSGVTVLLWLVNRK
jgi:hypothetical protein